MTLRSLDFESSAYASSATSARPAGMVQPAGPLGCGVALSLVRRRPRGPVLSSRRRQVRRSWMREWLTGKA